MSNNPKLVTLIVSIALLQFVEAAAPAATKLKPNPVGCPALNPNIRCFWYNKQCDDTTKPCSGIEICCPNECGTSCRIPDYYEPSPIEGCPPINTLENCFWFYKQCNDSDKQCPADSICCGNNCGTFCVGPNGETVPNDGGSVE